MKPGQIISKIIDRVLPVGLFMACAIGLAGCIHEYPHPVGGNHHPGADSNVITAYIEVNYEDTWQNLEHQIEFSSKAGREAAHRFKIEVRKNNAIVCSDTEYLSDDMFASGRMRHKLSVALSPDIYDIAVWYDIQDENGDFAFDNASLDNVSLIRYTTTGVEFLHCGYGSDTLDLTEFSPNEEMQTATKEIPLVPPGARFELIATDVNEFIAMQKNALNQGDTFTVHLEFSEGGFDSFNTFTSQPLSTSGSFELAGRMRLPFAEYEALKIAEGFIFSVPSDLVKARLRVTNSSLATVTQTDFFTFPVKRGYVTTVRGDFLVHPIDGIFSIDSLWEGELFKDL